MSRIFIPSVATVASDLKKSFEFLKLFPKNTNNGLMLIIREGLAGLMGEVKTKQYQNFFNLASETGDVPVIIMVSNLPLTNLNFYKFPKKSADYIKKAIDFAHQLPNRAPNAIVSFHLNTLLEPGEIEKESKNFLIKLKKTIIPILTKLSEYALSKNIRLVIETTPVPEFGDTNDLKLNSLINPYPIYSKYFKQIRNAGAGIALDLCHTFTLLKKNEPHRSLMDEINELQDGDVIHLNDSRGEFDSTKGTLHEEGVTLGEGDIADLPEIISYISKRNFNIVFEINETDYINRPNLIKSINYFKKYATNKN